MYDSIGYSAYTVPRRSNLWRAAVAGICLFHEVAFGINPNYPNGSTLVEVLERNKTDRVWCVLLGHGAAKGVGGLFWVNSNSGGTLDLEWITGAHFVTSQNCPHPSQPASSDSRNVSYHALTWWHVLAGSDIAIYPNNSMTENTLLCHGRQAETYPLPPYVLGNYTTWTYYGFPGAMRIGECKNKYETGYGVIHRHFINGDQMTANSSMWWTYHIIGAGITNLPGGIYNNIDDFSVSGTTATPKANPTLPYPPIIYDPDNPDITLNQTLFQTGQSITWHKDTQGNWVGVIGDSKTSPFKPPEYSPSATGGWRQSNTSVNPVTGTNYKYFAEVVYKTTDGVDAKTYWVWEDTIEDPNILGGGVGTTINLTNSVYDFNPDIVALLSQIRDNTAGDRVISNIVSMTVNSTITNNLYISNSVEVTVTVTNIGETNSYLTMEDMTQDNVNEMRDLINRLSPEIPPNLGLDNEILETVNMPSGPTIGKDPLWWDVQFTPEYRFKCDLTQYPAISTFRLGMWLGLRIMFMLWVYNAIFNGITEKG